jgi:hypothetical protein
MKLEFYLISAFAVLISGGCVSGLPEGEVPDSLVGDQKIMTAEENAVELHTAEAAMCGAIVRVLIQRGYSPERIPVAFTMTSSGGQGNFVDLMTGTDMIRICGNYEAKYLLDSKLENGVWTLKLMKKDGSILMQKIIRYRQTPPADEEQNRSVK